MRPDKLHVLWSDPEPDRRRRTAIGLLWREGSDFFFGYVPGLQDAEQRGMLRPAEFPHHERTIHDPYHAKGYLFPTFRERVPSPRRPDRAEMLRSWGVTRDEEDDSFAILARSGGILVTDRIELAEYRPLADRLDVPLEFRLAGPPANYPAAHLLKENQPLRLEARPHNTDENAVQVFFELEPVGYVPRVYSQIVSSLLCERAILHARTLRRLRVPSDRGRWIIEISRLSF
jgi:hypothetical protein